MTDEATPPAGAAEPEDPRLAVQKAQHRNAEKIAKAADALQSHAPDKARSLVEAVLDDGRLKASDATRVIAILEELGDTERAEQMRAATIAGVEQAMQTYPESPSIQLDSGLVLLELELRDKAEAALRRALALDPKDMRAGFPLLNILLQNDDPDALVETWQPVLDAAEDDTFGIAVRSLVKGLGHFGYTDHALRVAESARPRWKGSTQSLDKLIGTLRGGNVDHMPLTDAVREFDAFAEHYDDNLAAIGNNGPNLIGRMIERLAWTPEPTRNILDAGCGTGLVAPYLRPYANLLHGCDLSIPMLEKSKARNIYDLLTRTDLSSRTTFPEGLFDAAICADVFVYFGDLVEPLKNVAASLKPGGWLIFTVEDATQAAPARGWERYSSGRFRHTEDYVRACLPKAGFASPKAELRDTLRHEFGAPIPGLCVATQKLAFVLN